MVACVAWVACVACAACVAYVASAASTALEDDESEKSSLPGLLKLGSDVEIVEVCVTLLCIVPEIMHFL